MEFVKLLHNSIELKDGKIVKIRKLTVADLEKNNNYEFLHKWRKQASKYLYRVSRDHDLETDRKKFFEKLAKNEKEISLGAFHKNNIIGMVKLSFPHLRQEIYRTRYIDSWSMVI